MPDQPPVKRVPQVHPVGVHASACASPPRYAELHCKTNFSFLEGASHSDELVQRAAELGYAALAITDRNSLAGVVRAHVAAREVGLKLIIGAEIWPHDAPPAVLWATDRAAYGRLSRLLTVGRRRAAKGECDLSLADLAEHAEGLICGVAGPACRAGPGATERSPHIQHYRDLFPGRCYLLAELHHGADDARQLAEWQELARAARVPLAAANDVHCHDVSRQPLQDVLAAVRHGCTVAEASAAGRLFANGERCLHPSESLAVRFAACPEALSRTLEIADRCRFSLDELRYEYPEELVPLGWTPLEYLTQLTWEGAAQRFALRHGVAGAGTNTSQACISGLPSPPWGGEGSGVRGGNASSGLEFNTQPDDATPLVTPPYPPFRKGGETRRAGTRRNQQRSADSTLSRPAAIFSPPYEGGAGGSYAVSPPDPIPDKVRQLIEHELQLIAELRYEAYFLTVWDLVRFARSRGILCQGRGSAANSAVCYCLGVTSVDPDRIDVLFERFISKERNEAPDIDVDFEHERREEVLQYIYGKYGRERAGMTAEVITYRPRSAVRDVGKALGLSLDCVDRMAKSLDGQGLEDRFASGCRDAGLDPLSPLGRQLIALASQLVGFPRHLSQHVGGMVITQGPLCELVPIENAAMPERTVVQWDKDDLDALGLLKVDCLCLGMLTAIRKCFGLLEQHGLWGATRSEGADGERANVSHALIPGLPSPPSGGEGPGARGGNASSGPEINSLSDIGTPFVTPPYPPLRKGGETRRAGARLTDPNLLLAAVPPEDPAVYDMIGHADTMGVFQIESRAQMSMLPRLRPRCFYDLVIEVAIVRPGPIQGKMVHPYLRRRAGLEPVEYPNDAIRQVLHKTLGVPIFQEQAMRLAVVAAGFTPGEADQLRRAMGAWRKTGVIDRFRQKFMAGMQANGYTTEYAERAFQQIRGFGEYGFPESHSASFALLVYVSAWLKHYYPAVFAAGLLNSQPMGFYAPAQLVRNLHEHGGEVRPIDVNFSQWDCTLQCCRPVSPKPALERRAQFETCPETRTVAALQTQTRSVSALLVADPMRVSEKPAYNSDPVTALRLGFRLLRGLSQTDAETIVRARGDQPFRSLEEFARRTKLSRAVLAKLARGDAFGSLDLDRRAALWEVLAEVGPACRAGPLPATSIAATIRSRPADATDSGSPDLPGPLPEMQTAARARSRPADGTYLRQLLLFADQDSHEPRPALPAMTLHQQVVADYRTAGLSLRAHPVSLIRDELDRRRITRSADLATTSHGRYLRVAGVVLVRQRPGTARGITFVTLEDETGVANLIVRPEIWDRYRHAARGAAALIAHGSLERQGEVIHLMVNRLEDLSPLLREVPSQSRDFR